MNVDLKEVVKAFDIEGNVSSVKPFGSGHINDSYRVAIAGSDSKDYFLQRINHHVFKDVEGMMRNIQSVTSYLSEIYSKRDDRYQTLTIIQTKNSELYTKKSDHYWRLYLLIEGLKAIDKPESVELVYEGAKGFGEFISDLSPYDASTLNVTIPFFHHMPKRLSRFREVVEGRKSLSDTEKYEVDFVNAQGEEMCKLQTLLDQGELPLRVTHNDTKFNNILFDEHQKARCVIDLDTVMPGLVHFDYGDGIRTGTNTAEEDERDLSLVEVNMEAFEAYTNGFFDATREILTDSEIKTIVEGALMMTFIMGVRFLTDHLEGDKYYKISYPGHNLVRARCQLELVRKMIRRKADLISIAKEYS